MIMEFNNPTWLRITGRSFCTENKQTEDVYSTWGRVKGEVESICSNHIRLIFSYLGSCCSGRESQMTDIPRRNGDTYWMSIICSAQETLYNLVYALATWSLQEQLSCCLLKSFPQMNKAFWGLTWHYR